jgi:hypothetical protein
MNKKWSLELCHNIAKLYLHKIDWAKSHPKSYDAAHRNGWVNQCCCHMVKKIPPSKWNFESTLKKAKQFSSRSEWARKSSGSYKFAKKNNLVTTICEQAWGTIPKKANGYWNLDRVLSEASKYQNRQQWIQCGNGSYNAAVKKGWLELATNHMKRSDSARELQILKIVQDLYPSAHRKRFGKKGTNNYFEIDIFIPELNKGIEFNGTYWHGEGFRPRKFYKTPDEYHTAKRQALSILNIDYIEVWEHDWKADEDRCRGAILSFLKP